MKKYIIEELVTSKKLAILNDGILEEVIIDEKDNQTIVSNVYRGVVKSMLKGMSACFVDIGYEKLGYLPLRKKDINKVKTGQEIMVQVNKDKLENKGPKLDLEIGLSGRYLVYIPSNKKTTISKKIKDEDESKRLLDIINNISFKLKDEFEIENRKKGFIIRTEAIGMSENDLYEDAKNLFEKYLNIEKEFNLGIGVKCVYSEIDKITKYLKDHLNENVEEVITNSDDTYIVEKKHIKKLKINAKLKFEDEDVFDLYGVSNQIENCLKRKVWLKSGGYLIIDKTEAMTVIDINTGKCIGQNKQSDTVYLTNKEAAVEIARQIKIRDLSGIIIVDFIDMDLKIQQNKIIKLLNKEFSKDSRNTQVKGITNLGLIEIARRREGKTIVDFYRENCSFCEGTGSIKSINYMLEYMEKEIMRVNKHTKYKKIDIELSEHTISQMLNEKKEQLESIQKKYKTEVKLIVKNNVFTDFFNIKFN